MADATPLPVNVSEFEALARHTMDPGAFDYYAGAACDEETLARNRSAYRRFALRPRVLVDVSTVDTSRSVLGTPLAFPIVLAPTALNRLGHPDGELAAARAAAAAGTAMTVSTTASATIEEIRAASTGPLWFQLYVYKDRGVTRDLVQRAEAAGYAALVLTVDMPRMGRRERDVRSGFALPPGVSIRNLEISGRPDAGGWAPGSSFMQYVHDLLDPSLTWESLEWLRSITRLPLIIKGILSPDDAERALQSGADGVVVSNHGGRQLDGALASIEALPDIADRVAGRLTLLMDGGVRRGTDVLKALALGADAVLIGRPYLWGLAADGERGVGRVLALLRAEFELAMALAGCPTISSIDRSLVVTVR